VPSFLDSAYQILKEANRPMSQGEITDHALINGLLITHGATPEQTMGAMIYMDIIKRGLASRFIKVGPNKFALNKHQMSLPKPVIMEASYKPHANRRNEEVKNSESTHKLLDRETESIHTFLRGKSEQQPTSEKICDWVNLCYLIGLTAEGAELFNYVDAAEVNGWYYERTKKMARLCNLHKDNQ
jgi:hypothetical protein